MTISRFSASYFSLRVNFEIRFILLFVASRMTTNKRAWLKVESSKGTRETDVNARLEMAGLGEKVKNNSYSCKHRPKELQSDKISLQIVSNKLSLTKEYFLNTRRGV